MAQYETIRVERILELDAPALTCSLDAGAQLEVVGGVAVGRPEWGFPRHAGGCGGDVGDTPVFERQAYISDVFRRAQYRHPDGIDGFHRRIHTVIKDGVVVDLDALPVAPLISSMAPGSER